VSLGLHAASKPAAHCGLSTIGVEKSLARLRAAGVNAQQPNNKPKFEACVWLDDAWIRLWLSNECACADSRRSLDAVICCRYSRGRNKK